MVCFDTPSSRPTSSARRPASNCFNAPIISASLCFPFDITPLLVPQNHIHFPAVSGEQVKNKRAIFQPNRVVIETADGTLLDSRDNPEQSFAGQQRETPWDEIHVAYFVGEALWTYLNTPFLYTQQGFATEEIPSIQVAGETWRRLKVTFPDRVKSHTREQISCFGPDGLLRRHDYTVDILGGATGLNYASDYRDVDGILFPTKRRVYAYQGDYQRVPEPLLVAIDITEITLAYS